jgi:phosphoribosylanthranilate isomerase
VNESIDNVITYSQQVPGSVLQFHGDETSNYCRQATQNYLRPYIGVARISSQLNATDLDLVKYIKSHSHAQAVLLDTHVEQYGGSGQVFNWSLIPPNVGSHLVLSGGLTSANVIDGITQIRPRCRSLTVDVSSGVESEGVDGRPIKGLKDAEKILRFVAAVRAADAQLANHHVPISTT